MLRLPVYFINSLEPISSHYCVLFRLMLLSFKLMKIASKVHTP
jgi:hypothetical protein